MFDFKKTMNIARKIKNDFPEQSQEIAAAFEVLNDEIAKIQTSLSDKVNEASNEGEFVNATNSTIFLQEILEMRKQCRNYQLFFSLESTGNPYVEHLNTTDGQVKDDNNSFLEEIPIDIPRGIRELTIRDSNDFTGKKAYYFLFENRKHDVRSMKDVLMKACALLAEKDREKMQILIEEPDMQGHKWPILSVNVINENGRTLNEKILGTEIYVLTNGGTTDVVGRLRKIFDKYAISRDALKIGYAHRR